MLESAFQKSVLATLRKLPDSYWIKTNDRVTIGLPDILGWVMAFNGRGYSFALELKTQTKLTKLQAHTLAKMKDAGVRTYVVYPANWPEVFDQIEMLSRY